MNTRECGSKGEQLAKAFLENKGYKVIEENFWCRYGEIDLIVKNEEYLVFVEVKFLNGNYYSPQEQVNYKKQIKLQRVARYYQSQKQINDYFRFDVVAISNYRGIKEIQWIEDAFWV